MNTKPGTLFCVKQHPISANIICWSREPVDEEYSNYRALGTLEPGTIVMFLGKPKVANKGIFLEVLTQFGVGIVHTSFIEKL